MGLAWLLLTICAISNILKKSKDKISEEAS